MPPIATVSNVRLPCSSVVVNPVTLSALTNNFSHTSRISDGEPGLLHFYAKIFNYCGQINYAVRRSEFSNTLGLAKPINARTR